MKTLSFRNLKFEINFKKLFSFVVWDQLCTSEGVFSSNDHLSIAILRLRSLRKELHQHQNEIITYQLQDIAEEYFRDLIKMTKSEQIYLISLQANFGISAKQAYRLTDYHQNYGLVSNQIKYLDTIIEKYEYILNLSKAELLLTAILRPHQY